MRAMAWITATLMVSAALGGCDWTGASGGGLGPEPPRVQAPPEADGQATYLKDMVRGNEETPGPSAVDSAMVWARKYTEATERIVALEKANRSLESQRQALSQKVDSLEQDLARARREIEDANEMILAVREENRKWKDNVLGFRGEFLESQQAMMDYQIQIIKLLGGEPRPAEGKPQVSRGAGTE